MKIEETIAGLQKSFSKKLQSISETNAASVAEYIAAMKSEVNLSNNIEETLLKSYAGSLHITIINRSEI